MVVYACAVENKITIMLQTSNISTVTQCLPFMQHIKFRHGKKRTWRSQSGKVWNEGVIGEHRSRLPEVAEHPVVFSFLNLLSVLKQFDLFHDKSINYSNGKNDCLHQPMIGTVHNLGLKIMFSQR